MSMSHILPSHVIWEWTMTCFVHILHLYYIFTETDKWTWTWTTYLSTLNLEQMRCWKELSAMLRTMRNIRDSEQDTRWAEGEGAGQLCTAHPGTGLTWKCTYWPHPLKPRWGKAASQGQERHKFFLLQIQISGIIKRDWVCNMVGLPHIMDCIAPAFRSPGNSTSVVLVTWSGSVCVCVCVFVSEFVCEKWRNPLRCVWLRLTEH